MQKAACEAEAITKLAQIITQIGNEERLYYDSADSDKLKEVKIIFISYYVNYL